MVVTFQGEDNERFEQEYLLELRRGPEERLERAFLLPNVSSYEHTPEPTVDVAWSIRSGLKARPVKQSSGLVEERITIRGLSGEEERERFLLDTRSGSLETSVKMGGVAYFEAFLKFLREYEAEAAEFRGAATRDLAQAPQLIFRSLKEGLSWYVDQVRPAVARRVGSSRMTYEYTLSLVTEGVARSRTYDGLVAKPQEALRRAESAAKTALGGSTDTGRRAISQSGSNRAPSALGAAVLPEEVGALDTVERVLQRIPGDLARFKAPVETFARQVAEAFELVDEAVRAGLGFPRDVAASLRGFADRAVSAVYRIWDGLDLVSRDPARLVRAEVQAVIRSVQRTVERVLGTSGSKLRASHEVASVAHATAVQAIRGQLMRTARLLPFEDLAALAARLLGDAGRWPEIADANGMTTPWELPDGRALEDGVLLLVPVDAAELELRPDSVGDIFGTDLQWDFRRQDILVDGDEPTDFVAISGRANLRQGCTRRATSIQGRVRVFPGMGVPARIGSNTSTEQAAVFASQLITQFGRDARIRQVRRVKLLRQANILQARIEVEPVVGEALSIDGLKSD